jgi:hypothetical protein
MTSQLDELFVISSNIKKRFVELALAGTGPSGIHPEFDSLIEYFNESFVIISKLEKTQKYLHPFHKVRRDPFFQRIEDITVPFRRDFEELPPYNIDTVPADDKKWSDWIISHCNQINGFTSVNNTWMILRMMYPDTFGSCPIVRKYAYYIDYMSSNGTVEPYLEQGSGNFINNTKDASLGMRCKLALNAASEWLRPNQSIPLDVIVELYDYLFMNLGEGALTIKKVKYPFLINWFAGSSSGKCLQWDEYLETVLTFDKSKKSTSYVLNSTMDSINEMNDEMTKIGLPKLKKYLNQMLRAKVTIEGHAAGSAMVFIEAIFGYLRDNFAIVIRNQIDESNQRPIDNPEGHENPGYAPEYLNLMRDFASKIAWQSEEDFHASASSHMTTRSVGLFPADSVDPEVTGSPITEDVPEFSFEYEGRKFLFKGSDKVTWYMIDPQQRHLEPMDGIWQPGRPGKVGLRSVGSRKERAIFMGKGTTHMRESLIARALEDFSATRMMNIDGEMRPVTTTQRDTGRAFTDHSDWAYATSQLSDDSIVLMQDFSSLDQTSKYDNMRRFWVQAFEEVYSTRTSPMVDGKPSHQWMIDFWKMTKGAMFLIPSGPDRSKDYIVISPDMLLSGEYGTRYVNDMTTYAFSMYAERMMKEENVHFAIRDLRIQGDDLIEVRRVSQAFQSWTPEVKTDFLIKYKQKRADLAHACGLSINPTKFLISPIMFEFLKKMMVLGVYWPRYMQAAMGQNEAERVDRSISSVQRMTARVGQHREYIYRGGPFLETMLRTYHEWNLIRRVNISRNQRMLIPFAALFTPLSDGGVGILPWMILDPNVDVLLRQLTWSTKTTALIDAWAIASGRPKVNTVRDKAAAAGGQLDKAVDWFSSHNNQSALAESQNAYNELKERFNYEDPVPYFKRAIPMIRQTFEDSPQLNADRVRDKQTNTVNALTYAALILPEVIAGEIVREPHPLEGLNFVPGDQIPFVLEHPIVAGLDPVVQQWVMNLGTSARADKSSLDVLRTMKKLLNRSSIPNNLNENMADRLAQTIINEKMYSVEAIQLLFLSRGSGDAPALTSVVAESVAKNVKMLRFISDISNFSIAGDPWTDKSLQRISRDVLVGDPFGDTREPISDTILHLGFQWVRNQPLYVLVDNEYVYRTRRKVFVDIPDEIVREWMVTKYGLKADTAFYNIRDPTLVRDFE